MITSPITTPHFHSRVLALLSSSLSEAGAPNYDADGGNSELRNPKPLVIPPLSPVDTPLTPDESMSQIVAVSSAWTDLCSPDPFIAAVSEDILKLEIAYAAFCGISYVLIPGPRLRLSSMHDGSLARYARAILEALSAGPYIQIQLWMPIIDHPGNAVEQIGDLAPFARPHFGGEDAETQHHKLDLFGTWAAWDFIRSICKYHNRLCVGKQYFCTITSLDFLHFIAWAWSTGSCTSLTIGSSSSFSSQTSSSCCYSSEMALRTRTNAHTRCRVFHQKPKRLSSLIKGTPSVCQSLHAASNSTVAATL
jgi:hypothetical protein